MPPLVLFLIRRTLVSIAMLLLLTLVTYAIFFQIPAELLAPALIGIRIVFYLFNLIPLIYLPLYSAFLKPKEQVQHEQ